MQLAARQCILQKHSSTFFDILDIGANANVTHKVVNGLLLKLLCRIISSFDLFCFLFILIPSFAMQMFHVNDVIYYVASLCILLLCKLWPYALSLCLLWRSLRPYCVLLLCVSIPPITRCVLISSILPSNLATCVLSRGILFSQRCVLTSFFPSLYHMYRSVALGLSYARFLHCFSWYCVCSFTIGSVHDVLDGDLCWCHCYKVQWNSIWYTIFVYGYCNWRFFDRSECTSFLRTLIYCTNQFQFCLLQSFPLVKDQCTHIARRRMCVALCLSSSWSPLNRHCTVFIRFPEFGCIFTTRYSNRVCSTWNDIVVVASVYNAIMASHKVGPEGWSNSIRQEVFKLVEKCLGRFTPMLAAAHKFQRLADALPHSVVVWQYSSYWIVLSVFSSAHGAL